MNNSGESFLKVIDSKDQYTEGHCERVAKYTNKLCEVANVSQRQKERIVNMAKIHDIGKIYVDDEILKSNDPELFMSL
jgi:HD-GYP domain-containing protein (c-di-GMP phosphodiesterase class II)